MKVEKRIQALIDMGVYDMWVKQINIQGNSQYRIRRAIDTKRVSNTSIDSDRCYIIDYAFTWCFSGQGSDFWRNISRIMYDMGF